MRKILAKRHLRFLLKRVKYSHHILNSSIAPVYTIILPLHNAENSVYKCLKSLEKSTSLPHSFVIIFDGCKDLTQNIVKSYFSNLNKDQSLIESATFCYSRRQLYETLSDYIGFNRTMTQFALEIQSDMFIADYGFDTHHINYLVLNNSIIATSGRGLFSRKIIVNNQLNCCLCGTSLVGSIFNILMPSLFNILKKFIHKNKSFSMRQLPLSSALHIGNGSCSHDLDSLRVSEPILSISIDPHISFNEQSILHDKLKNRFYTGLDYCIRGPLFVNTVLYQKVGGLNIEAFFLGYDDVDLFLRAKYLGYGVAFSPVKFTSPLELGVSRQTRSFVDRINLAYNLFVRSKCPSISSFQTY